MLNEVPTSALAAYCRGPRDLLLSPAPAVAREHHHEIEEEDDSEDDKEQLEMRQYQLVSNSVTSPNVRFLQQVNASLTVCFLRFAGSVNWVSKASAQTARERRAFRRCLRVTTEYNVSSRRCTKRKY